MVSSKTEIQDREPDSQIRKKVRLKRLACWLLVDLAVAAVIFALLLYRPGRYDPFEAGIHEQGEVHPYITHLSSEIYNGAQLGEPFELVVAQKGINEAVTWYGWPMESEGVLLYAPAVLFVPGAVVLMGTVNVEGVELVVTIELDPKIDEKRLLNLQVSKVKVGAMNVTPLAKMMAKKMYSEQLAGAVIDTDALQTKIAASLLTNEPFEAVFTAEDRKVRVEKVTIQEGKLLLRLVPAP